VGVESSARDDDDDDSPRETPSTARPTDRPTDRPHRPTVSTVARAVDSIRFDSIRFDSIPFDPVGRSIDRSSIVDRRGIDRARTKESTSRSEDAI